MGNVSFKVFVFLLLLVAVVADNGDAEEVRRCKVGASYNDGCNECTCQSPKAIACTLMLCEKYDPETKEYKPYEPLPPPPDFWEDE